MKHYLLSYDTAPDYLQRRAEFRSAHLTLAWQAAERGELLLGVQRGQALKVEMCVQCTAGSGLES